MQFTKVIIASILAATAVAAPAPVAVPQDVAAEVVDFGELGTVAKANVDTAALDLTLAQCQTGCKGGTTAMKAVCRVIPNPIAKAACSVAAAVLGTDAGQEKCAAFCDKFF